MIELENVVFRYPESERGVGPVSFSIKEGERVAITGASGCGKSTLLRLIMGLYEPDSGKILLDGTQHEMQERRRLTGYGSSITIIRKKYSITASFIIPL